MAVTLRTAGLSDTDAIADLLIASRAAIYRGVLPDAYLDDGLAAEVRAYWHEHMPAFAARVGTVIVAEEDHRVIAFIALFEPDAHGSVYVGNLHAAPDRKSIGSGTALLSEAARWSRGRGARAMHLLVLESNRAAARFYDARGWTCTGPQTDTMGGIDVVVLRYERVIDEEHA